MSSNRENVYSAINNERSYQEKKWGATHDSEHTVGEWLLIMESELSEAKEAWVKNGGDRNALLEILQVISVGVACLEVHGVVERERCGVAHPQPVATLCEEVSRFLGTIHDWHTINLGKARLQEALTAERKRAVLVGNCIDSYERLLKEITRDECKHPNADSFNGCYLCNAVGDAKTAKHRLDAFDRGAENG